MDYYKKYQKYKFKYLNLLNQSGGDRIDYFENWDEEEFEKYYKSVSSLNETEQKNILEMKLPLTNYRKTNIISDEEFTIITRYYEICFKIVENNGLLLEHLNKENVEPLFSYLTNLNAIYYCVEKQKSNYSVVKNYVFSDIEKLKYADRNIRQEYNKKLNNLQFFYLEICIKAVQQNEVAFDYVYNNQAVITRLVLKNERQPIPQIIKKYCDYIKNLKTFSNIEFIDDLKKIIEFDKPFEIDIGLNWPIIKTKEELNFTNNFRTKEELLERKKYYNICMEAVNKYPLLLEHVIVNNLDNNNNYRDYYTICFNAVQQNYLALQYVKFINFNYYTQIINEAVKQNKEVSKLVNKNFIRSYSKEYEAFRIKYDIK
jgi:hypothetical protein